MVAFAASDLPPNIDSIEKLAIWSATILNDLAGSQTYEPDAGVIDFLAQAAPVQVFRGPNVGWRYEFRVSVPIGTGDFRRAGKIWSYAQPLSSAALPVAYRSA
ncbi:MAG: hypothetical protein KME20_13235 [Kaiparowitsia implicata GSE-PSE-MK54-09C]|jgi:hypothetical protein|nr:hypothetical protein [Kaiparowitsia implicata GSE-PSE-MK54-09C]